MEITLRVRSYDTRRPGEREEALFLDAGTLAVVELHCWNIGTPGGIPVPEEVAVFLGSPENHAIAAQIMSEQIAPVLTAARRIGLPIVHVQPQRIASRYAHLAPPLLEQAASPPESAPMSEQEIRRRERVQGAGYWQWLEQANLDVAEIVRPQEGDVMIAATDPFEHWLHERGITTLLYTGFATNLDLLDAPGGMKAMAARGYRCILLREATLAVEFPDTLQERLNTQAAIRHIEAWVGYSASITDFLCACETAANRPLS